jgi:hypothetical protein
MPCSRMVQSVTSEGLLHRQHEADLQRKTQASLQLPGLTMNIYSSATAHTCVA